MMSEFGAHTIFVQSINCKLHLNYEQFSIMLIQKSISKFTILVNELTLNRFRIQLTPSNNFNKNIYETHPKTLKNDIFTSLPLQVSYGISLSKGVEWFY